MYCLEQARYITADTIEFHDALLRLPVERLFEASLSFIYPKTPTK